MRRIKLSIHIHRARQDVFDFLSDPANLSKWNSVMESAAWTSSDPAGVGSTYNVLAKMPGGMKKGLFEITQWDPPQRYGYRSREIAFPFKSIESTISLAPQDGGTELTFEAQFALAGLLSLVEGMFVKMAEKGDGANLAVAKRLLEAAQHGDGGAR
jgi:hypothetical protein